MGLYGDQFKEKVAIVTGAGGGIGQAYAEALATLHEAAGSSLREIDRLATAAMREAARRKKRLVERDLLAHVVGVLQGDAD